MTLRKAKIPEGGRVAAAVLNALWAAPEVVGRERRVGPALPHEDVLALLAAHGRIRS